MKTLARITGTLALLLCLYVLGYWLLFRKEWAYNSLQDITKPWHSPDTYNVLYDVFDPVRRLDFFFTTVVPFRKSFTGHWSSESGNDFVILGSDLECHFKLGSFAFEGKATYSEEGHYVFVEFFHQEHRYYFNLSPHSGRDPLNTRQQNSSSDERADAFVFHVKARGSKPTTDYRITLTKQSPSAPSSTPIPSSR